MLKNKGEQWLTLRMHNIIRCCTCKRKSHCRCCTFERRSRCNETFVMHDCFISRSKSRVQCVNLKYLPTKLFEICWFHGSSFKSFSIVFPAPWLAKVESSQKSNGMWFFRDFFAPFLFDHSRNNRRDKLRSKFWREKNVQKTTFEAAEMILGPWNLQKFKLNFTRILHGHRYPRLATICLKGKSWIVLWLTSWIWRIKQALANKETVRCCIWSWLEPKVCFGIINSYWIRPRPTSD